MPVDVLTLPPSSINTKWKEPYASASLNSKLVGVIAPGIYRGLRLIPDPSSGDRTIVIEADANADDHVAVAESSTGFSVSYRDAISGDITLSLAAYSNVSVVVSVFISYAIGTNTTGAFRVYTEAEYNGLASSVRDHLVVLGTVAVPASGAIPASSISLQRRTLASSNLSSGAILNAPLVRNADFEVGETNATHARSSLFWDKSVTVGTGSWKTDAVTVDSGMKSIELNVTAGPLTGELSQQIGVQTVEGQLFLVSVRLQQRKTITSGTLTFFMEWSDVNDALLSTTTQTLDGAVDLMNFRTVETIIPAPAGAASLRAIGIRATAFSPISTGIFGYIDGVNVDAEPVDAEHPYPFDQSFRRAVTGTSLALVNKAGTFADAIASIRFDPSTPSGEGRVLLEPGNSASLPPTLALPGRLHGLGSSLIGSEANALKPRIEAGVSVVGGVDYTLMWQSVPVGGVGYRKYVSSVGSLVETVNAAWGGTTWSKDVSGAGASMTLTSGTLVSSVQFRLAANNAPWSSWDSNPFVIDGASPFAFFQSPVIIDGTLQVNDTLTMQVNDSVAISGTGKYRRGSKKNAVNVGHGTFSSFYSVITLPSMGLQTSTSGVACMTQIPLQEGETLVSVRLVYNAIAAGGWTVQLYQATGASKSDCYSGGQVASVGTGNSSVTVTCDQNNVHTGGSHNWYVLTIHQGVNTDEIFFFEYITKVDP